MQQEGDNSEAPACGAVFNHFGESGELLSLVRALPQVCGELRSREKSEERFTSKMSMDVCTFNTVLVNM